MAQIKIEVTFNTNEETLDQALAKLLSQASTQGAPAATTKKPTKQKMDAPATAQPDPQPDAAPDPQPEAETEVKTDPASEETASDSAPAPEEKPVSKTDVRAVATALTKAGKREALKAIFKKFGGEKLSDIQEADYGLAQWTFWSRKQGLLEFARAMKRSIGDLEMQLGFLMKELAASYGSVLSVLKTAKTVKAASDSVLVNFERPADQSDAAKTKRAGYGQTYYDKYAKKEETSTMATKITTAAQLAERCLDVAQNYKTVYMWGVFGAPVTESVIAGKAKQYPSWYTSAKQASFRKLIGQGYFGFDCVCLIKGLLWGWNGDASKNYGGASYTSNGVPDIGADTMITKCKDVSTTGWADMEVGEALWVKGHIGIYVGNGLAVECTPAWKNKVQITAVKNIGTKAGYNARTWTKHGKLPYVTYTGETVNTPSAPSTSTPSTSKPTTVTEKRATEAAYSFNKSLAGAYAVTASSGLHIRNGAGTNKASLAVLPKGTRVQNYGYYTLVGGVKWLYVQVTYRGVKYTGFCSAQYLAKK